MNKYNEKVISVDKNFRLWYSCNLS